MNPRTAQLVLVGLLFAVVAVAAAVADPQIARVPAPRWEFGIGDEPADRGDAERADRVELDEPAPAPERVAGPDLGWLAGLGLLVLLGVGLYLLWRSTRGRVTLRTTPPPRNRTAEARDQLREAVAATLDELDADGTDPRAAVIGCWLRLEKAAERAGTRREPADTAADLVARMLAEHRVSAPVLDRLATVYRQARYAPHEIGEAMRDEARAALARVHTELSAEVGA